VKGFPFIGFFPPALYQSWQAIYAPSAGGGGGDELIAGEGGEGIAGEGGEPIAGES
jgi:hypothetical protein